MNIIITGASRGIGEEMVRKFASTPENTIIAISRNLEKLELLANECRADQPYSRVIPIAFDLLDVSNLPTLLEQVNEEVNHVDILINNAGYLVNKAIEDITPQEISAIYGVNVTGPILLTQQVLPLLKKATKAHVVNISSMGGFQGSVKFPGLASYASSKAAIASFTECLAEELKETSVKCNCLALGAVATEMLAEAFPGYQAPTTSSEMANYICDFAKNGHKMFNGKILPVSSTTP